jgi:hypothetical protein
MEHFAGLDVSVKETSVCIVGDTGRIVREVKVASEPAALLQVLTNSAYRFKRVGLEAGQDRAGRNFGGIDLFAGLDVAHQRGVIGGAQIDLGEEQGFRQIEDRVQPRAPVAVGKPESCRGPP